MQREVEDIAKYAVSQFIIRSIDCRLFAKGSVQELDVSILFTPGVNRLTLIQQLIDSQLDC